MDGCCSWNRDGYFLIMAIEPSVNHPVNCGLATTPSFSRQFAKQSVSNRTADLDLFLENTPISSGSSSPVTFGDINYTRNTYPTSATNVRVLVNYLPEKFSTIDSLESENSAILSKSTTDPYLFEYESVGTTSITATFNTNEKTTKKITTSTISQSATQDVFQNFLTGSLGRHIYEQIREYADGSTSPPNHYPIYSTFDYSGNNYVKNVGHWMAGLDFSGLMVNKVGSGGTTNVSAITPHHAIGAGHYPPAVGDVLYFCDANNQTVARTVQSRSILSVGDCVVVRFSEALPATVKKYKTLPSNFTNYIPINRNFYSTSGVTDSFRGAYFPIVVTSHYNWDSDWPLQRPNRYAYFYQTSLMLDGSTTKSVQFVPASSEPNNFTNYNGQPSGIRGGDSGSPCFFIINNDLVLIHCHTSGGGGSMHPSFLSEIQSAIDTLGPSGQTYETVSLSGFTNFSS